jgi:hypothetical protein
MLVAYEVPSAHSGGRNIDAINWDLERSEQIYTKDYLRMVSPIMSSLVKRFLIDQRGLVTSSEQQRPAMPW